MADGMLSLSWNNHRATFCHILATLREKERYTDVTVACEGKFYPVHKLVLSTCSEYFEKIFENTPCKHPVIVLKDVNRSDLEALFCYMYEGAVSVAQSNLGRLIKAAEVLRIKGLAVPDEPPISEACGRRTAPSHHHVSDDRSSPHPKRRRREENSHTQQGRTHSSPSPPSSPRHSPLQDGGESQLPQRMKPDSQWGEQVEADREEVGVDGSLEDRVGEQSATSRSAPTPPQVEVMVDETLVKEEMIDQGDPGQEDIMDSGMDYGSVGSDSRLDGSAGGGEEDPMLPNKYEPKVNPSQAIPEAVVEALAGPSGMQAWLGGGEMPPGFSGLEGYTGGEGGQDLHQPSQAPAAHQLVWCETISQELVRRQTPDGWQGSPNPVSIKHEYNSSTTTTTTSTTTITSSSSCCPSSSFFHNMPPPSVPPPLLLATDLETLVDKKPFSCEYCPYKTARKTALREHINSHTGKKPYICPYCPYRTCWNSSLVVHVRTHTGEKPYSCSYCSYQASQRSSLKAHLLTHQSPLH